MGGVMMKTNLHKDHAKRKPHAKMVIYYFHYGRYRLWNFKIWDPNLNRLLIKQNFFLGLKNILQVVLFQSFVRYWVN